MKRNRALFLVRVASGGVFVAFGAGKFVNHTSELASFKAYGLPAPGVFVVLIGVVELVGGVLLIAGVLIRPAAAVLAGDMIGAIVISGIAHVEHIYTKIDASNRAQAGLFAMQHGLLPEEEFATTRPLASSLHS